VAHRRQDSRGVCTAVSAGTYSDGFTVSCNGYALFLPLQKLPDGTFSRNDGWSGEPNNGSFVWYDDSQMGLTLLARLALHGAPNTARYIDVIAAMDISFAANLYDPVNGIMWHAYNGFTGYVVP
jgi:hypothetical protein